MARTNFEKLQVYQLAEKLADKIRVIVLTWHHFAKVTVGEQLVDAADGVGSNIAEGSGRGSLPDNRTKHKTHVKSARNNQNLR